MPSPAQAGGEGSERRLFARYDCDAGASCRLLVGDGEAEYGVDDISEGGLRITAQGEGAFEGYAVGQKVRLGSSRGPGDTLFKDIAGTVVWMENRRAGTVMGIEFVEPLQSKLDTMLRLFLESDAGRGLRPGDS